MLGTSLACLTQHNVAGVNAILKVAFCRRLGIASTSAPHPPSVILSLPKDLRLWAGTEIPRQARDDRASACIGPYSPIIIALLSLPNPVGGGSATICELESAIMNGE
jgi:hypothetical protein